MTERSFITLSVKENVINGKAFVNDYVLLSSLGRGSYGEAILAENSLHQRLVLKAFSKSRLLRQRNVRRIGDDTVVSTGLDRALSEVTVMTRLKASGGHRGIVELAEVLADPGSDDMYFVLEFADAGPVVQQCSYLHAKTAQHIVYVASVLQRPWMELANCPEDFELGDGVDIGDGADGVETVSTANSMVVPESLSVFVGSVPCSAGPGPLPVTVARHVLSDVLEALAFAHAAGVTHRDVKPDNILMTKEGYAKLADWGSACLVTSSNDEEDAHSLAVPVDWVTDTTGTYAFLSPEACGSDSNGQPSEGTPIASPGSESSAGSSVGGYRAFAADAWAAGVSLYIMVFGVLPFGRTANNPYDLFTSIQRDPLLPLPFDLARDPSSAMADAGLQDLVAGLLTKDPERRLSVAAALQHPWIVAGAGQPRTTFPPIDVDSLPPFCSVEMAIGRAAEGRMPSILDAPSGLAHSSTNGAFENPLALSGWLWKRGRYTGWWLRRFFVLSTVDKGNVGKAKHMLVSSKAAPVGWKNSSPLPAKWLSSVRRYPAIDEGARVAVVEHDLALDLRFRDGSRLHLRAESGEDLATWSTALQAVVLQVAP